MLPFCEVLSRRGNTLRVLADSVQLSSSQELPSESDVVVVGGGSIGCSVFYHLTKLGVKNCVLLERDRLTSGTTWHTAGLHWHLRPNDVEIDILKYTRELISTILPEETGQDAGWINNGGLFIAVTKERMDEYKRLMTVGKAFGINSYTLSPKETKELYPLLNVDDIYGALFSPGDGLIDPSQWTAALTKAGTKRGGKVFEKTPVTNVLTSETDSYGYRKVTGIETQRGRIKTPMVVNCAGAWGPELAAMVGVDAPTIAYRHAYVITEGIKGIRNMPNVRDHDGAFYLRLQGDSLQVGGYEYNPDLAGDKGKLPEDFSFGLYNVNWDTCFGGIIDAAVHRLPVLGETGIKSEICGPLSFTPDDKPLIGETAGLKGFFMSCGYDLGMMMGGGAGREVAKWVLNGRPDRALYGWDVRRFNPKVTNNATWIRERTHERFATMYDMVIPKDEPLSGRNILKTPFHDQLLEDGAFFQDRHSWERAGWFSPDKVPSPVLPYDFYGAYGNERHKDYSYEERLKMDYSLDWPKNFEIIKNEALACRNGVVGFDMSYFGKFYISGPDCQAVVDYIFSADMRKATGQTVYSCMLNNQGRVEADLTVSVIGSGDGSPINPQLERGRGFYVAAGGGSATHDWIHIQDAIQEKGFDVKLQNVTEDIGILSVQGPNSRALLEELAPDTDFCNDLFPFSTNKIATVAGHRVRLMRLSFVGEMGWEIHAAKEACPDIYRALKSVGAEKYGFRPAGYRSLEPLSAEKGYRFWDSDLRLDDTPLEAGLAFTCKLKTDIQFKGREAIEKQKAEGIKKRIVCILLDDQVPLFGLETIFRNGEPVGYTRRGEYAFTLNQPIAYGYISRPDGETIKNDWIKSGTYTLEALGEQYPAKISLKSPFDPEGKRLQGNYN